MNATSASIPRPRPCPVCRSTMIAQDPATATLFRCDDCGCVVDLRWRAGDPKAL